MPIKNFTKMHRITLANTFVADRINKQESVVFVAAKNETNDAEKQLIGFCQIYTSFCSVIAEKIGVLYDLFVDSTGRKTGAGRTLILAAYNYAANNGMARLDLSTAKDNLKVQALYESLGWVRDDVFYTYNKETLS